MNLNEFLEMKNEFAEYIYRYEYFLKCGTINDCYYTNFFGGILREMRTTDIESKVMTTAIALKTSGKSQEEIDKYLEEQKKAFKDGEEKLALKDKLAKNIVDNNEKLSNEDKKQFEIDYLEYVKTNHPIVKCLISDQEEQLFQLISKMYKENNYSGYKEILSLNKNIFTNPEYKEEDFTKISGYYYDIKKNINADYMKKQNSYPYNKQETLKNEISVAREKGDLTAKLNEFKAANRNIHKDFINAFSTDFSLI